MFLHTKSKIKHIFVVKFVRTPYTTSGSQFCVSSTQRNHDYIKKRRERGGKV